MFLFAHVVTPPDSDSFSHCALLLLLLFLCQSDPGYKSRKQTDTAWGRIATATGLPKEGRQKHTHL